ncbi:alpha/beta hydrolase family protein [Kiloniella sp.]|uniref:alpha/beta hydrolase family protein n=1 Tax=Kiloniella sp. TaxID=1938587 RepID=UPI003A93CD0D
MLRISFVILVYFSVSSFFLSFAAKADETVVGIKELAIESPGRTVPLKVMMWYPARESGEVVSVGQNAVFEGTVAQENASIISGTFPVVLLSHGGMRSAPNQSSWLASKLVKNGFIVVDVKAPALGYDDALIANQELWKRPNDISTVLTEIEKNPDWRTRIDRQRIGAVGFFLGGTSVLSLVGARIDKDRFVQSCDEIEEGMDCKWFEKFDVNLRAIDLTGLGKKHLDKRIQAAVIIDPELTTSFSEQGLEEITVPVRIINLGSEETIPRALNASGLARKIPNSSYTRIENATHFSAFSVCKPKGAFILKEEGAGDEICVSDVKVGRENLHNQIADTVTGALNKYLKK